MCKNVFSIFHWEKEFKTIFSPKNALKLFSNATDFTERLFQTITLKLHPVHENSPNAVSYIESN